MATAEQKQIREIKKNRRELRAVGLVALIVIIIGMVFYHNVEAMSWVDALYFAVITLTTVGYGDIFPVTDAGKLFTVAYVVIGIGIIATFAKLLLKSAFSRRIHHAPPPANTAEESPPSSR
jgi:voltage-gated potassium channel Kch